MKLHIKLLLLISFFFLSNTTQAQTDAELSKQINDSSPSKTTDSTAKKWEPKTIFKSSNKSRGYYGSFTLKYGTVENSNTTFIGGRGGWIINHKIAFGFGGYGLYSQKQNLTANIEYNYSGGYGGFIVEPIFYSDKIVHVSMPIMLGGGWVGRIQNVEGNYEIMYSDLVFLAIEPGIEVDFNITNKFRIALGAYYTIANDIDSKSELSDDIMNNLSVGLQFKWGLF